MAKLWLIGRMLFVPLPSPAVVHFELRTELVQTSCFLKFETVYNVVLAEQSWLMVTGLYALICWPGRLLNVNCHHVEL